MKKLLVLITFCVSMYGEIVVVVNQNAGFDSMGKDDVKKVFLAKSKTLPDGKKPILLDQDPSNPAYKTFYKSVANKSISKMNKYWVKLTFTGKAESPKKLADSKAVADFIKKNNGAIGYVDAADAAGLKIVYKVN